MSRHPYYTRFSDNRPRGTSGIRAFDAFERNPKDFMLPVRPVVLGGGSLLLQDFIETVGSSGSGDVDDVITATKWKDDDNHDAAFEGPFDWYENMYPYLIGNAHNPGAAALKAASFVAELELLDADSNIVATAEMAWDFAITDIGGASGITEEIDGGIFSNGGETPARFNAIRGRVTRTPTVGGNLRYSLIFGVSILTGRILDV